MKIPVYTKRRKNIMSYVDEVIAKVSEKNATEPEFLQTKFNLNEYGGLISKLKDLSIDTISPIEALNILFELKKMVE
jgi:hypothetical protein